MENIIANPKHMQAQKAGISCIVGRDLVLAMFGRHCRMLKTAFTFYTRLRNIQCQCWQEEAMLLT